MVNEYKRLVLLKGLTPLSDEHFSLFKSLMSSDLRLERNMQEQYTKVQIADMMEDEFPDDAGLGKIIKFCEDLPVLRRRAEILKNERSKVIGETSLEINRQGAGPAMPTSTTSQRLASERRETSTLHVETSTARAETSTAQAETSTAQKRKSMRKEKTEVKKTKGSEGPDQPPCSEEDTARWQSSIPQVSSSASSNISLAKTPRRGTVSKEPSKELGHHQGPKQVMVLKVTEPFTYDMIEDKRMFHATVATETEFFRVKVFDTDLQSKFIPRNIIAISDYFGCNGFLEIYRPSCVSDVNVDQTMVISKTLRQRANATPKISHLFLQTRGTFVNGEFAVIKKTVRNEFIYYGIEDDTGKMEVVVYGRLTNINCEPGSKLRLVCFELTYTEDTWQLRSVRHSYMQVINARR